MKLRRFFFPLLISSSSLASSNLPKLCEEHAQTVFKETYWKPNFTVLANVSYAKLRGDQPGKVVGELDILVLDGRQITAVGEVKYAGTEKNIRKAKKRAQDQLNRFIVHCLVRRCIFIKDNEVLDVTFPKKAKDVDIKILAFTKGKNQLKMEVL